AGGEKPDPGADFFRLADGVAARDANRPRARFEQGGQQAQGGGFAGPVGSQQPVNPPGFAAETDAIHRAHLPALAVAEHFGQLMRFDHKAWTGLAVNRHGWRLSNRMVITKAIPSSNKAGQRRIGLSL